jgi:hypothetical protein
MYVSIYIYESRMITTFCCLISRLRKASPSVELGLSSYSEKEMLKESMKKILAKVLKKYEISRKEKNI